MFSFIRLDRPQDLERKDTNRSQPIANSLLFLHTSTSVQQSACPFTLTAARRGSDGGATFLPHVPLIKAFPPHPPTARHDHIFIPTLNFNHSILRQPTAPSFTFPSPQSLHSRYLVSSSASSMCRLPRFRLADLPAVEKRGVMTSLV